MRKRTNRNLMGKSHTCFMLLMKTTNTPRSIMLSDTLNVSVGVPVANRFNIYQSPTSACTGPTDTAGTVCTLEIAAFERTGNPVVDGTVANVVSSCGGVGQSGDNGSTGSCIFGAESFGRCEVEWVAPEGMLYFAVVRACSLS